MTIRVPMGTVVCRLTDGGDKAFVADINDVEQTLVAKGGMGGAGNARFVSAVQQEPVLAEKGEEGEGVTLLLELKLLADVGLIGLPNAGKSTLLSMCSAARPRIAPYPFTTTDPVLGVVANRDKSFVMMEVPGLIEGAHKGAGLGHEFLRHVERARLLLHLLDVQSDDPVGDWRRINQELISFNLSLGEKPQFIVVNKVDIPEVQERVAALRGDLESLGLPLFFISAATGEGVGTLLGKTLETLDSLPQADMEVGRRAIPSIAPRVKETFRVSHENGVYVVHAPRVERLVPRANLRDRRVMLQIWQELERLGVAKALEEKGVQVGDTVRLGEMDLEWF